MSEFNTLEKNVTTLQEKIYGMNFDISKSYLPDKEIVKNIIKSKNPNMTKDDVELMVEGNLDTYNPGINMKDIKPISTSATASTSTKPGILSNTITSATASSTKKVVGDLAKKHKLYPMDKNSVYYQEAKKIKSDVRESVMMLFKEQKELMQDLAKTSIQVGSSISGAAILIAPLSFNVPGAISVVLLVIDAISKIISKMMNIIMHLGPLKYLVLLIPANKADSIIKPINTVLKILISLFDSTKMLQKLIDKLMSILKKRIKGANSAGIMKEKCDGLKKELAELMGQLLMANKFKMKKSAIEEINKKISEKKGEIEACEERANMLLKAEDLKDTTDGNFEEVALSDIFNQVDPTLNEQMEKITEANKEFYSYVYDVHLPDGSIMANLTDDELDDIRSKYNIIFEDS